MRSDFNGMGLRTFFPRQVANTSGSRILLSAGKRRDADIVGIEPRRKACMDPAEIFEQRPVR